ncbi:hypothetical protein QFZ94_000019 [Paraburkholderia sp. JPY465]|uniref:hypothetical protein n=1 Tax=Paraburkholderia sp. JPY465 TaxID=3042285 RepID=UPI003D1BBE2F
MSNYGAQKASSINTWSARHPRFHAHFTPTSASWINRDERWFATLSQTCVLRGTHRSTRQFQEAIRQYIQINNTDPFSFADQCDK